MAKARYIKIGGSYFPMANTRFSIHRVLSGKVDYVAVYDMSRDGNALVYVSGEDATNLIGLLDEMSLPIDLLREENG
jgi:hypothetical protein